MFLASHFHVQLQVVKAFEAMTSERTGQRGQNSSNGSFHRLKLLSQRERE